MHKTGRTPERLLEDTRMRPCPDGRGCYVLVQRDENPIVFPASLERKLF